jgi:membrane-bound serine protease (ClpP class)
VVQVQGDIDLGLAPYLVRVLDDAEREGATAVVVEINTPGGRLDAALQMRQALLDSPVRTIAWVNRDAFSAGALIAIAANEVYMAPGAVIGAATPVTAGGQAADPKTVSAVRSTFRSTAELRGRDPQLAEAMVDPSIAIDGLVTSGQLLTLTTTDARAWGYADAVVADRQALLQTAGLAGAAVRDTQPALAERLVRVVTHPLVASLLMTVGLLLILADVFGGGGGVPSVVGAGLMAFFFWGHMLAGLAGWEGVVLVGLGVALLAVEAFVIPGFGVAGVLGIAAFAGGLFISLIGGEIVTSADLVRAATTVGLTLMGLIGGGIGLAWLLVRTRKMGGLVLQARLGVSDGKTRPDELKDQRSAPVAVDGVADLRDWGQPVDSGSMLGARGVATSDLRPGGIARFAGERVDVITRGELLPAGTPLEIIRDDGYRRVVRRCEPAQGGAYRPTSTSRA